MMAQLSVISSVTWAWVLRKKMKTQLWVCWLFLAGLSDVELIFVILALMDDCG